MCWKTSTLTISSMKIHVLFFTEQEVTMLRSCILPLNCPIIEKFTVLSLNGMLLVTLSAYLFFNKALFSLTEKCKVTHESM